MSGLFLYGKSRVDQNTGGAFLEFSNEDCLCTGLSSFCLQYLFAIIIRDLSIIVILEGSKPLEDSLNLLHNLFQ